jgi:hypothetical protein
MRSSASSNPIDRRTMPSLMPRRARSWGVSPWWVVVMGWVTRLSTPDLTAGARMGPADLLTPVGVWRKNLGQMIAPEVASQLARSIRSLPVRVHRQNDTAAEVAAFLTTHPRVSRVNYPGLARGAAKVIVDKQMRGGGGMLSFVLDCDRSTNRRSRRPPAVVLDRAQPGRGCPPRYLVAECTTRSASCCKGFWLAP